MDCANGVGAPKLHMLAERLNAQSGSELCVDARNVDTSCTASLNECCGADFVQKERQLPEGFQGTPDGARHALLPNAALYLCSACEHLGTQTWKGTGHPPIACWADANWSGIDVRAT